MLMTGKEYLQSIRDGRALYVGKERAALKGRRAAVILSGQNFDRAMAQTVLNGGTPQVA